MTIGKAPICMDCIHYNRKETTMVCKAYPFGIPEEIIYGEVDHHDPYKGDHGIQFKAKE